MEKRARVKERNGREEQKDGEKTERDGRRTREGKGGGESERKRQTQRNGGSRKPERIRVTSPPYV